jgi:shikimate dehydrogenase
MIRAAVLGAPIAHSLSPALHSAAYAFLGISGSYEAIELTPEMAPDFFVAALQEEWTGFSLTMPLKETIVEVGSTLGFEIDPIAMRMRSANTLMRKGKTFAASSTDRTAFINLLAEVTKEKVAIIGGGGTARAALSALDGFSTSIDFLLRSSARRELLSDIATESALNFYGMDHPLDDYDLVISTVPAGATDDIALSLDRAIPTLFEVLYKPYPTPLLAKARALGSHTIDGMDLLVEQAIDQIALFTGASFDREELRKLLLQVGRSHLD